MININSNNTNNNVLLDSNSIIIPNNCNIYSKIHLDTNLKN